MTPDGHLPKGDALLFFTFLLNITQSSLTLTSLKRHGEKGTMETVLYTAGLFEPAGLEYS